MATDSKPLQVALTQIRQRIAESCQRAGRQPDSVLLIAVSKTFPVDAVVQAANAGQRHFGENYLQEAVDKISGVKEVALTLQDRSFDAGSLVWHFIGPLQSNKTRAVAEHFDWVHSIEREKVARRLSEQRPAHLPPLNVCIQVNVSGEQSKSGATPEDVSPLAAVIASLPRLRLRGLMCIPEATDDGLLQRQRFARLRSLLQQLNQVRTASQPELDTLSMGMSADMEAAILEGATMVRIGTAIFGSRTAQPVTSPDTQPDSHGTAL
jgi:pyridoxal phosphate enzyme (YggS family)